MVVGIVGKGVAQHARCHAGGFHERVADGGFVVVGEAYEAATGSGAGGFGKCSVEHAAGNLDSAVVFVHIAHESAMIVFTGLVALDGHRTPAIGDVQRTPRPAHETSGIFATGGDSTGDVQVLDTDIINPAERGSILLSGVIVDGHRVAAAVERAFERIHIRVTHHCRHVDVLGQLHVFACVHIAVGDVPGKGIPFIRVAYYVGAFFRASTLRRPVVIRICRNDNVATWHGEPIAVFDAIEVHRIAVGILHVNVPHSVARCRGHRDGLVSASPWLVDLPASADHNGTGPLSEDADGVGILDGMAIQVVAAGSVVFALVECVVHV